MGLEQMIGQAVDLAPLKRRVEGLEDRVQALEGAAAPDAIAAPDNTTINESGVVEPEEGGGGELPIEAQGDLITGDAAGDVAVLPVGEDGQVLTVDSTAPDGVEWEDMSAPESGGEVAVPELVNGQGLVTLSSFATMLLIWTIDWGAPTNPITKVTLGGIEATDSNTALVATIGPRIVEWRVMGTFAPGTYNLHLTIPEANKLPRDIIVRAYQPPGGIARTSNTTINSATAEPKTPAGFVLPSRCFISTGTLAAFAATGNLATEPVAHSDAVAFRLTETLFLESGAPFEPGREGLAEVLYESFPAAGEKVFTWNFSVARNWRAEINALEYG